MIDKLKYFCNKILPLVYDDSLSYYEVLCKVSDKINEVIDNTNGLLDAWNEYKNDIDSAFGKYTTSLDAKFAELSARIEDDFYQYRKIVDEAIKDEFAKQEVLINEIRGEVSDQNTQIAEINSKVSDFIAQYNAEIAKLPQYARESVLEWLSDTTNYDNIIADLSGQIQGVKHFDTVADMVNSSYTQIVGKEICVCLNYYEGDNVFTMWEILPFNTPPGIFADEIGKKQLAYTTSDLTYRVAVLRSEYTTSTLGIATAPTAAERANRLMQTCRFSAYSMLRLDANFSVALGDINTTTQTITLYGDSNNRHTITLTGNNNFIANFKSVDIMHSVNNITHKTDNGVHFDDCNINSNPGATVIMSNIDIVNSHINCSQIQSTDDYIRGKYRFNNNTWIASTIFGIVLSQASVDKLEMLEAENNYIQNTSASRTRMILAPQTPARTINLVDNVIYNASVGSDSVISDGVLFAVTSIGTIGNFNVNIKGNIVYTSTARNAVTLGRSSDNYLAFTMLYKDNIIMLNSGTVSNPEMHSIISTEIITNGKFYPNFIGDLDISALLRLENTQYIGADIGNAKTVPFSATATAGYQPEVDGTLLLPEQDATYRAEVDIICVGATLVHGVSQYINIDISGATVTQFIFNLPVQHIVQTLYITPENISTNDGILEVKITSNGSITPVAGTVKLFRIA